MNIFSYLPTASLSLRTPYLFGEATSGTPETLVWKNPAFKNVEIPLDFTEVLLNKRNQTQTPTTSIGDFNGKEWNAAVSSLGRPSLLNNLSAPSMITTGAVTELRRHGTVISKPSVYRKYQFLDRQYHRPSQCYVHPPDCIDHSQCRSGNELASLKALCDTDVSVLLTKRPIVSVQEKTEDGKQGSEERRQLKFGMERILSDTFGKGNKQDSGKENNKSRGVSGLYPSSHGLCQCNPPCGTQGKQNQDVIVYSPNQLPSLSAVQSLHTPRYSFNTSVDSLPGPYSVLSTDAYNTGQNKRKRSWSRAVFSNLQRKGLEKRFEVQKYVTKLDRRQLANMLGLTDAQVKVWFQNRRMKWRHAQQQRGKDKESKEEQEVDISETDPPEESNSNGSELSNEADVVIEDNDEICESST